MGKGSRPLTEQVNTCGEKKKKATGSELWKHMAQDGRSDTSVETRTRKITHSLATMR